MKRSIFVLLACSFSFAPVLAAPPYHPPVVAPAHPPVRPPVMVRPPTLPNQLILEQRRARDIIESRREEEDLTPAIEEDQVSWGAVPDLTLVDLGPIFRDIKPQITGLDDETLDDAKERAIADLDNLHLSPDRRRMWRREIEQVFQEDADNSRYVQSLWLDDVTNKFHVIAVNLDNPSRGEIRSAIGEAIEYANDRMLRGVNVFTDDHIKRLPVDIIIDRSVNVEADMASADTVMQAMRSALGSGGGAEAQVASLTPPKVTPAPAPETPVVDAPAPPVAPENKQPFVASTPTTRDTVAPSPQVGTENTTPSVTYTPTLRDTVVPSTSVGTDNTQPSVTYTPTIRSTVTPSQPATSSPDLLTPVPAYSPPDGHSTPTTTVPIRTTSVPTSRDRLSGPPNIIAPPPRGPSFVSSIAAVVGPAIHGGLVTLSRWMDDHELLGREYNISARTKHNRQQFHGIGNGVFEGRLGFNMTPTTVTKHGFVRGSNVGGGLVL